MTMKPKKIYTGFDYAYKDKTNKLDEILEHYLDMAYTTSDLGSDMLEPESDEERLSRYNKYRQEAKQAIIELIEGDIIGEDIELSTETISDRMGLKYTQMQVDILHNKVLMEQRQKLAKLKD